MTTILIIALAAIIGCLLGLALAQAAARRRIARLHAVIDRLKQTAKDNKRVVPDHARAISFGRIGADEKYLADSATIDDAHAAREHRNINHNGIDRRHHVLSRQPDQRMLRR